jgi:uncharacterized protein (TIGR03083 family)
VDEPMIELLEIEWRSLLELGSGFDDDQWAAMTELPGWSVKDCYSHVIGVERTVRGEPLPEVDLSGLTHLTAVSAAVTEPPIELRRSRTGAEVLAELEQITTERLAELRALPDEKWDEIGPTPVGDASYREFMAVRTFDCWMHEQDVRRALDRPGHQEGPVVEHALARTTKALGFVVGKKAGAPDGSSVVFALTGPLARRISVVVDGRASVTDDEPDAPTAVLTMDAETLWCLGGGRWSPTDVLADGRVQVSGDQALGQRVVESLNFMI